MINSMLGHRKLLQNEVILRSLKSNQKVCREVCNGRGSVHVVSQALIMHFYML
jgi:hypothetical protein